MSERSASALGKLLFGLGIAGMLLSACYAVTF